MREIEAVSAALDPPCPARLGLVSLASDWTASDEIRALCAGPGRSVHESRIANRDIISSASLREMEAEIAPAAALLPGGAPYAAAAYLCTSASMLFGSARVAELMAQALPTAAITDPMRAGVTALQALGVHRIGLVTPYVGELTDGIALRFEVAGFTVVRAASFFEPSDARVARVSAASLAEAARRVARGAEAVFLSCTALRTVRHVATLERELGVAVTSSNQSVGWHLLRLAGVQASPGDWGRLFERAAPVPAAPTPAAPAPAAPASALNR